MGYACARAEKQLRPYELQRAAQSWGAPSGRDSGQTWWCGSSAHIRGSHRALYPGSQPNTWHIVAKYLGGGEDKISTCPGPSEAISHTLIHSYRIMCVINSPYMIYGVHYQERRVYSQRQAVEFKCTSRSNFFL